ncbi:hypothetical protein PM082_019200 [Marasmius tenuissimus]|nr:hypothetical protein PM082_019200 [Marasmius tenuissimus]
MFATNINEALGMQFPQVWSCEAPPRLHLAPSQYSSLPGGLEVKSLCYFSSPSSVCHGGDINEYC